MGKTEEIQLLTVEYLTPVWVFASDREVSSWLRQWCEDAGTQAIITIPASADWEPLRQVVR